MKKVFLTLCIIFASFSLSFAEAEVDTAQIALANLQNEEVKEDAKKEKPKHQWIETHGYARSGYGFDEAGGRMSSFKAPGAGAKFRLGNENDNYGEMDIATIWPYSETSPIAKFHFTFSYWSLWHSGAEKFGGDYGAWEVRQIFLEINNIPRLNPKMTFWAGVRYYDRWALDVNDFFIIDYSGYGGGIQGIPMGEKANLNIAWLNRNNTDDIELSLPNNEKWMNKRSLMNSTLELRAKDIPLFGGSFEAVVAPSLLPGGKVITSEVVDEAIVLDTTANVDALFGIGVSLGHKYTWENGAWNRLTLQAGLGHGYNFNLDIPTPDQNIWKIGEYDASKVYRLRATESATIPIGKFTLIPAIVGEMTTYDKDVDYWFQIGIRPKYNFTKRFALALDISADYVYLESSISQPTNNITTKGTMGKFTLAPIYDLGFGPQLRIFATYAIWPKEFNGNVVASTGPSHDWRNDVNDAYHDANATAGFSFGVQMDAWW